MNEIRKQVERIVDECLQDAVSDYTKTDLVLKIATLVLEERLKSSNLASDLLGKLIDEMGGQESLENK